VYEHVVNIHLLSLEEIFALFSEIRREQFVPWIKMCIPVAYSFNGSKILLVALENGTTTEGVSFKVGQVLVPTLDNFGTLSGPPYVEAQDYLRWLEHYRDNLLSNTYTVRDGEIILFSEKAPTLVSETTRNITVQASPLFVPEYSCIHKYSNGTRDTSIKYYFAYRIRMFMPKDAPKSETCQLKMRHWRITDAKKKENKVDGDGVIGLYPVMEPGAFFEYQSCCPMSTPTGFMEGSFTMELALDKTKFDITVPRYYFKYPPN